MALGDAIRQLPASPLGIQLWLVELDAPDVASGVILSEPEMARASRFVFERDRRRYLAAHRALRSVLVREVGIRPDEVFALGVHGKPALAGDGACRFNLSHSEHLALIGLAEAGHEWDDVGVDIEVLRPVEHHLELARQHFSAQEVQALSTISDAVEVVRTFLQGWTHKEACLKALGTGLSVPSSLFTLDLSLAMQQTRIPIAEGGVDLDVASVTWSADILASAARVRRQAAAPPNQECL